MTKPCPACNGNGARTVATMDPGITRLIPCEPCDGSGRVRMTDVEIEAEGQFNLMGET